eukprot:523238-Pleurochrysis_carterae.AAC.1
MLTALTLVRAFGCAPQDENLVGALFHHFKLRVRRFPSVSFLGCCEASTRADTDAASAAATGRPRRGAKSCFSSACVIRKLPSVAAVAAACRANSSAPNSSSLETTSGSSLATAAGGALVLKGKYRGEVELAVQHALALSLPGA